MKKHKIRNWFRGHKNPPISGLVEGQFVPLRKLYNAYLYRRFKGNIGSIHQLVFIT